MGRLKEDSLSFLLQLLQAKPACKFAYLPVDLPLLIVGLGDSSRKMLGNLEQCLAVQQKGSLDTYIPDLSTASLTSDHRF